LAGGLAAARPGRRALCGGRRVPAAGPCARRCRHRGRRITRHAVLLHARRKPPREVHDDARGRRGAPRRREAARAEVHERRREPVVSAAVTRTLTLVAGLLVLGVVNYAIHGKERVIRNGEVVFLELAPVDPRSLMQGDYMALRFQLAADIEAALSRGALDARTRS